MEQTTQDRGLALKPHEVAALFRVDPKTVGRWTKAGKMGEKKVDWFRTPGGHLRFWEDSVRRRLEGEAESVPAAA